MQIGDLPLDPVFVDHFRANGIEELYPPQAAAVEAGVCDGENVLAAIPTASGKTLISELALLTAQGPGLYICPLRALAREKYETFSELPGVDVGISTSDYDSPSEELAAHDIVVATSEKVDSAIRNGAGWVDQLACIAIDEVHLLGTERRGPTLEVTLATLNRRAGGAQLVALSATVANPEGIADWLNAELVASEWRPVNLKTGVYATGTVGFDDGTTLGVSSAQSEPGGQPTPATLNESGSDSAPGGDADTEATVRLVRDGVADGGQCLAFVRSRREAEKLCDRLTSEGLASERGIGDAAAAVGDNIELIDNTGPGQQLADAARSGVAFHHAGLRSAHRAAVESAFRDRHLACICATPTLAAGVNVPARRVVVRDQERYTGSEMAPIPSLEVHQMCGRAGRPGLDPYGEAILVGDEESRDELKGRYIEADAEPVESQLADPGALRTHVLSVVAAGFTETQTGILGLLESTYYAHERGTAELADDIAAALEDLVEMNHLERDTGGENRFAATDLGSQTSRQYVRPETGARIVSGLETVATMNESGLLTALELVCHTPDMQDTYLGNQERADMHRFVQSRSQLLTTDPMETDSYEGWLESMKTARILAEWIDGADAETLVDRYRIGPGDLESQIDRAQWLLGAASAITGIVGVDLPELDQARSQL
ncbi:MAG: superfamily II helicase [uncultured archaeon A07HR60]|nr:MAG: superfamily II helicase [uncultured archaeon A07HR60]